MLLVPITRADLADVLLLNQSCVPEVGTLDSRGLDDLLQQARLALLIRDSDGVAAFVLALDPSARYQSPNFRWFCERYRDFFYVDRIAVAARNRGKGLGRRLYDAVLAAARDAGQRAVTCEVNLLPPNPGSLAFHSRLGFGRVGELRHVPGEKEVAMLLADVPAGDAIAS